MDLFLQLLANGLVTGTFYALSALGLTLVFGLMRVVNFAHGELYAVGGLLGWALTDLAGFNFFLTLAVVIFSLAVGGYLIDRLLIARVRGQGEEPTILLTIGLSIFLTAIFCHGWLPAAQIIDPYGGVSENHRSSARVRLMSLSCGSEPPNNARRREASRWIKAFNPSRRSAA